MCKILSFIKCGICWQNTVFSIPCTFCTKTKSSREIWQDFTHRWTFSNKYFIAMESEKRLSSSFIKNIRCNPDKMVDSLFNKKSNEGWEYCNEHMLEYFSEMSRDVTRKRHNYLDNFRYLMVILFKAANTVSSGNVCFEHHHPRYIFHSIFTPVSSKASKRFIVNVFYNLICSITQENHFHFEECRSLLSLQSRTNIAYLQSILTISRYYEKYNGYHSIIEIILNQFECLFDVPKTWHYPLMQNY